MSRSLVRFRSHTTSLAAVATLAALALAACESPTHVEVAQLGYRGTGMQDVQNVQRQAAVNGARVVPAALPAVPGGGPLAKDIYQNVQVLTDLDVGQFTRLMTAMTNWVSPEQGCAFCHVDGNNAADDKYQKIVSRRMLEMTRFINGGHGEHVGVTGVTCFTCHGGQNVPRAVWFAPEPEAAPLAVGNRAGQNAPAALAGLAALPGDPLSVYLVGDQPIRVIDTQAIAAHRQGASIQDTERVYAFMTYVTNSLGVNCTYCHNTRSFFAWDQGRAQRVPAWHAIRLVRALNNDFLIPLQATLPAARLGPSGDAPKVGCATCHQGQAKPLNGARMLADYPELLPPKPVAQPDPAMLPPADEAAAPTDLQTGLQADPRQRASSSGPSAGA